MALLGAVLDILTRAPVEIAGVLAVVAALGVLGAALCIRRRRIVSWSDSGKRVFAALAEFIRELIVEGTREGLVAARARGVRLGRPPAMTFEQVRHARELLTRPDNTVSSIARLLNVSRSTIYKYVPELTNRQAIEPSPPSGGR